MIKIFIFETQNIFFETQVLFSIYVRLPANQFPCKAL